MRFLAVLTACAGLPLTACSVTVNPLEGTTAGTGENSAFTDAGVAHIIESGRATLDLRGQLDAADLGATEETPIRDVDVREGEPIEVTVRGERGDLVVQADVIRVLAASGGGVEAIALFEEQSDGEALSVRLAEVGPLVGADPVSLESYLAQLGPEESDIWLNGGDALGFTTGLHPVHKPDGVSLIEFQLSPQP